MRIKPGYIITFVLLFVTVLWVFNTLEKFESSFQDALLQSKKPVNPKIVIVGIDEASLEKIGRWPFSRRYHAELIDRISAGKPAVIGVDIIFSEASGDPAEDSALVNAAQKAGNVVMPSHLLIDTYEGRLRAKKNVLVTPFDALSAACTTGYINTFADPSDGVIRRTQFCFNHEGRLYNSFAYEIYSRYMHSLGKDAVPFHTIPTDFKNETYIDFTGRSGDFRPISYYDVVKGNVPPDYFAGKIVLVGPYASGINIAADYFPTPLHREVQMFGVEIHANIIQYLLTGKFKQEAPFALNLFIIALFCAAGYFLSRKLGPVKSIGIIAGTILLYLYLSKLSYAKGYILPLLYPLLLITAVYLVMLAYHYLEQMLERRRITNIFGRYVAPQIVNRILDSGEEGLQLGGTKREITALFVDIRGFTPLSEKVPPEGVVGILNAYLDLCAKSIFRYEGTLDKFIGDATMAIYNAPLDLEEHALKAVKTAWAMKEGSEILRKELEEKYERSVQFGIGINTGPAVVGNIGTSFRMDYTAIGDTVNTAARLESNAKPGQILISQSTYEMVKDRVETSYLGEIKVKGKEQGVPVYQVEGIR